MSGERRRQLLEPQRKVVGDLQELADLVERLLRPTLEPVDSLDSLEDADKVVFIRPGGRERRGLDRARD